MKIDELYKNLQAVLRDWPGFLNNSRGIRNGSSITWANYKSSILDDPVMISHIRKLAEEGQYTFQVEDGSLIQIYYSYDRKGERLQAASLAFYSTTISDDHILRESAEGSLNENGLVSLKDSPVGWLRIDYAPSYAKGVLHYDCHMHLSTFPDSRIVVAGVPSPRQFIEFIAACCYPETYKTHRLDEHGEYLDASAISAINAPCFPIERNEIYTQIAHFRIPANARRE